MTKTVILPLDRTGTAQSNQIEIEYHRVEAGGKGLIRLEYGAYFYSSLRLWEKRLDDSLTPLVRGVDYFPSELVTADTEISAGAVYSSVILKQSGEHRIIAAAYQALGGRSNPNNGLLAALALSPLNAGKAVDYAVIEQKSDAFKPAPHLHDASDLYQLDRLVQEIRRWTKDVKAASAPVYGTVFAQPDYDLGTRYKVLKGRVKDDEAALRQAIRDHITGADHKHVTNPATLGLGSVRNYPLAGYLPVSLPDQAYCSPATLKYCIENPPAKTTYAHVSQHGAAHGETKATFNLSKVENHPLASQYTDGNNEFSTIFDQNAPKRYVSALVLNKGVNEQSTEFFKTYVTPRIGDVDSQFSRALSGLSNKFTLVRTDLQGCADQLAALNTKVGEAKTLLIETVGKLSTHDLKDQRAVHGKVLEGIMAIDFSKINSGMAVAGTEVWPLPGYIDNLQLWLDVDHIKNVVVGDTTGEQKLMVLSDRSTYRRDFVANSQSSAPTLKQSADILEGVPLLCRGKVAAFSTGDYLQQLSGTTLSLAPNMTIFVVSRIPSLDAKFTVLSDWRTGGQQTVALTVNQSRTVAATIAAGGQEAFKTAPGTIKASRAVISVICANKTLQNAFYCGSTQWDANTYPKGVQSASAVWPNDQVAATPLSYIGKTLGTQPGECELKQLLVFSRQLSYHEIHAVVEYLRLASCGDADLSVNYSPFNQF